MSRVSSEKRPAKSGPALAKTGRDGPPKIVSELKAEPPARSGQPQGKSAPLQGKGYGTRREEENPRPRFKERTWGPAQETQHSDVRDRSARDTRRTWGTRTKRNAVRELVGWMKGGGDGGLEFGVGGVIDGTVGLPEDVAVGIGEEDVSVVGGREVDQFFPFVLVIVERHKMRVLGGGNVFAHAVDDHAADHGWSTLQLGELIDRDAGITGRKIGGEALGPAGGLLTAFVGEADGENEVLLAARFWEDDFGIVEGFGFDGRDGLCIERGHSEKNQHKD